MPDRDEPYGLAAEFGDAEALLAAAGEARQAGYRAMEAYTPFPVEGLAETIARRSTPVGWIAFFGGLAGGAGGLLLQWYASAVDYPLNVGGRPLDAWPAFILPAFEMAVLFAALGALGGFLAGCRLPRLHHPVFGIDGFHLASDDRFFLVIEGTDPGFDTTETRRFLESLEPVAVREVSA